MALGAVLTLLVPRWVSPVGRNLFCPPASPSRLVWDLTHPCPVSRLSSGPGRPGPRLLEGQWVLTGLLPPLYPPLAPRSSLLSPPTAASLEFTHFHVKALLLVWGLGLCSAVSRCPWEGPKSFLL